VREATTARVEPLLEPLLAMLVSIVLSVPFRRAWGSSAADWCSVAPASYVGSSRELTYVCNVLYVSNAGALNSVVGRELCDELLLRDTEHTRPGGVKDVRLMCEEERILVDRPNRGTQT
jgi:hypothetical protein